MTHRAVSSFQAERSTASSETCTQLKPPRLKSCFIVCSQSVYEVDHAFVYHAVVSSRLLDALAILFGSIRMVASRVPSIVIFSPLWWHLLSFLVGSVLWLSHWSPCLSMRYTRSCEAICGVLLPISWLSPVPLAMIRRHIATRHYKD